MLIELAPNIWVRTEEVEVLRPLAGVHGIRCGLKSGRDLDLEINSRYSITEAAARLAKEVNNAVGGKAVPND